jgi:hypothetical protein
LVCFHGQRSLWYEMGLRAACRLAYRPWDILRRKPAMSMCGLHLFRRARGRYVRGRQAGRSPVL